MGKPVQAEEDEREDFGVLLWVCLVWHQNSRGNDFTWQLPNVCQKMCVSQLLRDLSNLAIGKPVQAEEDEREDFGVLLWVCLVWHQNPRGNDVHREGIFG